MTALLDSVGPAHGTIKYHVHFESTRFGSTVGQNLGALYIYRPLGEPGFFSRGPDLQPGICMQAMLFAGCVIDIEAERDDNLDVFHITIGLCPSPNEAAHSLLAAQSEFLHEVARQDNAASSVPCCVTWGSPHNQRSAATAVVRVAFEPSLENVDPPFRLGDDVAFKTSLQRFEHLAGGVLNMGHLRHSSSLSRSYTSTMAPSTDAEVTQLYFKARHREPKFPGFAYGYLYATQSSRRRIVAVPYNYGTQKLTSVDELFVHLWVPNSAESPSVVDMSVGRIRVNTLPGSSVPWNLLIRSYTSPPLRLSSLVKTIARRFRKPVINMEREDAYLVDSIVSACIEEGLFRTQEKFYPLVDPFDALMCLRTASFPLCAPSSPVVDAKNSRSPATDVCARAFSAYGA
ncbi:hypothetical protein DFH06DRAFT_1348022 [Mycena polygramma]|nr:hypothetical protein DFH06DRAFT_1348022 [Mycena polygramma]